MAEILTLFAKLWQNDLPPEEKQHYLDHEFQCLFQWKSSKGSLYRKIVFQILRGIGMFMFENTFGITKLLVSTFEGPEQHEG